MSIEQDKYYIPTIEEFYVGFEYEITSGYEWIKKIFSKNDLKSFLYEQLENGINQNYIRVKYLDEQDIENLGFEHRRIVDQANGINIYLNKNNNKYRIKQYLNNHLIIYKIIPEEYRIKNDKDRTILFNGTIKSINELRKVLEFLNIK